MRSVARLAFTHMHFSPVVLTITSATREPCGGNGSDFDMPFIGCGSRGHAVNTIVRGRTPRPEFQSRVDHMEPGLILEKYNDLNYGYLHVTVDSQKSADCFHNADSESLR
jgi:hypothetical protein